MFAVKLYGVAGKIQYLKDISLLEQLKKQLAVNRSDFDRDVF
jgi:hypothetical protein